MINKVILSIAAILVLASCSSKFGLIKRRYNKGFYLAVSKNKADIPHAKEKRTAVARQEATKQLPVEVIQPEKVYRVIAAHETPSLQKNTKVQPVQPSQAVASKKQQVLASANNTNQVSQARSYKPLSAFNMPVNARSIDNDTNTILLVILCVLWWLNLVAVYLHDGKVITTNFWVTLLLDLTVIGGIVFSILVVLDIINLA